MRIIFATQYRKPCAYPEPGETAKQIIAACREHGATHTEDGPDDEVFVICFRDDIGPELYTEDTLRRSLPFLEHGDAPGPAEKISNHEETDR